MRDWHQPMQPGSSAPGFFVRVVASMVLAALALAAKAEEPTTLRVAGAVWCPYNCMIDNNPERRGFMFDMLYAIAAKQGLAVEYVEQPWRRAIITTRAGQQAALAGTLKTDTPDFVFGKQAFGHSRSCFVTRSVSKWQYRGERSLKRLRLAVNKDQTFGDPVDKAVNDPLNRLYIFFGAGSDYFPRQMEAVARGQVEVTLEDEYVIRDWLKQSGRQSEFRLAGCLDSGEVYISVPPGNPQAKQLVAMFDSGVQALRQSGELARILAKYGLEDWRR
ncbi:substrate-binding periplasmic protein [Chitinimonas prasina]|nr:transporter substrate-binding domain-containing protein [Chitinimonas prasina]